jgi:hypothetical protein
MNAPSPVAVKLEHYRDLLKVIRARVAELDTTHEVVDAVSELQDGYFSKLMCDPPLKRMASFTPFMVLPALGLALWVVEDPAALARVRPRLTRRQVKRLHSGRVHRPIRFELGPDFMRKIESRGGMNSRKNLPARKRTQLARRAARARWSRHVGGATR